MRSLLSYPHLLTWPPLPKKQVEFKKKGLNVKFITASDFSLFVQFSISRLCGFI